MISCDGRNCVITVFILIQMNMSNKISESVVQITLLIISLPVSLNRINKCESFSLHIWTLCHACAFDLYLCCPCPSSTYFNVFTSRVCVVVACVLANAETLLIKRQRVKCSL